MLFNAAFGNDRRWPKDASYAIQLEVDAHASTDGDCDNLLGTVMDAGNKIVWQDDRQIAKACIVRVMVPRSQPKRSRLIVEVLDTTGFEPKPARKRSNRSVLFAAPKGARGGAR